MTESDWSACTDPLAMLAFLRGRGASERKLRLFAVACCRDVWDLIGEVERSGIGTGIRAVRLAEHLADHEATRREVAQAVVDRVGLIDSGSSPESQLLGGALPALADADTARGAERVCRATAMARNRAVARAATPYEEMWRPSDEARGQGRAAALTTFERHAGFLRDIFGNPFRSVPFAAEWRTSTAVALAHGIYEERAFDRHPLLMDALMDAGCADEEVLEHCRVTTGHHRGCWVVDSVLGKE